MLSQEPPSAAQRARAALLADPARANQAIAELVGASRGTVARARQQLASAGLILGRTGHRVPAPAIPALPQRPVLTGARCATGDHDPGLWTSPRYHADRAEAIKVCRQCPARLPCAQWALSLPTTVTGVYGAMTASERVKAKRGLAAAG